MDHKALYEFLPLVVADNVKQHVLLCLRDIEQQPISAMNNGFREAAVFTATSSDREMRALTHGILLGLAVAECLEGEQTRIPILEYIKKNKLGRENVVDFMAHKIGGKKNG